jgi:hypothetical protein
MKTSIFTKAKQIVDEGRIKVELETDKRIFFQITKNKQEGENDIESVSFFYEDRYINHSCTCKHMTMTNPTNLCSHKLAAIMLMGKNER